MDDPNPNIREFNSGNDIDAAKYREAPIFNEDTTYRFEAGRPMIRVYTSINSRFILEDFISKLEILYGEK